MVCFFGATVVVVAGAAKEMLTATPTVLLKVA
jgi:hypothetical protein